MEQDRRGILDRSETKKMCSLNGNEAGEMCSPADADTCRDGSVDVKEKIRRGRNLLKSAGFRNPVISIVMKQIL